MAQANPTKDADEANFQCAVDHLPGIADKLDPDVLLYFYARYKQATVGPCNIPKPGILDFTGRKKWQAWKNIEHMPNDQARREYVSKLKEVDPSWGPETARSGKGTVYVSRMLLLDPESNQGVPDAPEPIFKAIKDGDLEEVKTILNDTPEVVNLRDAEMMTPLHWAADRGMIDIVSLLLTYSADLNAQDELKQTPMHYACFCGHITLAKMLYDAGADVNVTDQDGQKPVDLLEESQRQIFMI